LPEKLQLKQKAMKLIGVAISGMLAMTVAAQDTFSVTGTQIPVNLVKVNYGRLPKTIQGFDLNICNESGEKQSVTSSQIYQALVTANPGLHPLGRQIVMGEILRNQQRSVTTVLTVVLNSAVGVLSVLGAARTGIPPNVLAGFAVGSTVGQQLLTSLKPVLTADQVQRYESQVLETALVLDTGSCVERTVFALEAPGTANTVQSLTFHVR
jgi:hypothetical protein